jgi:hypothetical protein
MYNQLSIAEKRRRKKIGENKKETINNRQSGSSKNPPDFDRETGAGWGSQD